MAAVQLPTVSEIEFAASRAELRDLTEILGYKVEQDFIPKRALAGWDALTAISRSYRGYHSGLRSHILLGWNY